MATQFAEIMALRVQLKESRAKVARLEGELALASAGLTAWKALHDTIQGEKAAMAAALEKISQWAHNSRGDTVHLIGSTADAALFGEGKVWEQVKELVKVFEEDDLDEQDCRICGVVGHDHCGVQTS